jgi:competence protein ComEC
MLNKILQSKSKKFSLYCFAFLIGVTIASLIDIRINGPTIVFLIFLFVALLLTFYSNKKKLFVVYCLLLIFLGTVRYSLAWPSSSQQEREVTLTGYVAAEPDVRMDGVRYIVKTEIGKVYIKQHLYPRYNYGDVLELTCFLQRPEPIEDFRYDMYLARYRVFSICSMPYVNKKDYSDGAAFLVYLYKFKASIAEKINLLWHEPHASFMAGLLYGYRGGLGALNELFSRTGVTHIVAISGYNITIISTILSTLLVYLCIPRKKAFYIITLGIAIFVIFAGLSASVVRAGIMGMIVLLARQVGRTSKVGNVMLLTCVVMTIHNPFILIWDAGFQLSFLSTLGLVYFNPIIAPYFKKIPETLGLRESIEATLSATVITLPLILFQFGRLSVVSLPVNVLILWIIPFLMLIGFIAVVASYASIFVGQAIGWVGWLGLSYIIFVVEWFAKLSFAAVDIRIHWGLMILLYGLILYLCMNHQKKNITGRLTTN